MNFVILNLSNMVPRKLTEAELFALECNMHDNASYAGADLLGGWTESLLGETKLKLLESFRLRRENWEERGRLDRRINVLKDIKKHMNQSDRIYRR